MAYFSFSTLDADYIFDGTNHLWPRRQSGLFDSIDLLVTEYGPISYWTEDAPGERTIVPYILQGSKTERSLLTISPHGSEHLAEELRKKRVPVVCVDVHVHNSVGLHQGNGAPTHPEYWNFSKLPRYIKEILLWSFSKKQLPAHVQTRLAYYPLYDKSPVIGMRSALAAEKIVALAKMHKRPKIGILYGLRHVDMINYLLSPSARAEAIAYFRERQFPCAYPETIDSIRRYSYSPSKGRNEGRWDIHVEKMGLF